jgi:hypothetical protein
MNQRLGARHEDERACSWSAPQPALTKGKPRGDVATVETPASPKARRVRALLVVGALLAVAPFVALAVLGHHELSTWAQTGMCPAGPMDRPAAPCSFADLAVIVFLGGWVAFLVVPVLAVWELGVAMGIAVWWVRASRS